MRTSRLFVPGLVVFALGLLGSGVLTRQVPEGLPVTPQLTLTIVPIVRLLMFSSGALAFSGALLSGAFGGSRKMLRLASISSAVFSIASLAVICLTLADALATDWWLGLEPQMLRSFVTQIDEGRYLAMQVLIGAIAAWVLSRARQPLDAVFATVALGVAVVLPGFTGHSASALPHWIASATMVLHLLAMSAWVGGVAVLVMVPESAPLLGFGRIASVALPAVLVSGLASVIARVNDWASLLHDRYTVVLMLKIAVTGAVVWFAAKTRARVAAARAAHPSGKDVATFVRQTIIIEGSLMFVVLGIAIILARMPNP